MIKLIRQKNKLNIYYRLYIYFINNFKVKSFYRLYRTMEDFLKALVSVTTD